MVNCHSLTGELYYKEGGFFSRFKSRKKYWYLLDESSFQLICYRNQNDAAKNETPVSLYDVTTSAIKLSLTEGNQFILTNSGKNHIFTAENHESMMVWVLALQALRNKQVLKDKLFPDGNGEEGQDDVYVHDTTLKQTLVELSPKKENPTEATHLGEVKAKASRTASVGFESPGKVNMDDTLQNAEWDEVFEENLIKSTSPRYQKTSSRRSTQTDEGTNMSHDTPRRRSLSGHSASSDSAYDRSMEGDLTPKVNDIEEELISVKCELAEMKNREGCYKAVLERRDSIISQLDEKLDYYHELKTDRKGAQVKLREQNRSLQNKNHFLNEEVSKLSELRSKDQLAWNILQRKYEDLEMRLTSWRQDYLYLLQTSITIPTGDLTDGYEVNLFGGNRHRDRLKALLDEARATNPGLPTFEKLACSDVHIDKYGFKHRYNNEGLVLHYIAHQLHAAYKMQEASYRQHQKQWREVVHHQHQPRLVVTRELKSLVRRGIPPTCRKDVWRLLVYHHVEVIRTEKGPCYYSNLCRNVRDSEVAGRYRKQIFLDLLRTMPNNVNFSSASAKGTQKLQEVLLAFCLHNSSVGYCQGMNFIAAMALLFMDAEDAFWTLVAVTECYFSPSYFDAHLTGAQADQSVLKDIMADQLPPLLHHLEQLEIDISTITLNWFLALYFDAVPFETLLRIWDCFLLEGPKVLFRMAIAMLKINTENIMKKTDTFSIMRHLKSCPGLMFDADGLMKVAFEDLEKFPKRVEIQNMRVRHMEALKERLKKRTEHRRTFDDKNQLFRSPNDTDDPVQKQAFECAITCHQGLVWLCYGDQQVGSISLVDCDEVLMCNTDLELDSRIISACAVGQFILLGLLSGYLVLYHTKLRGEVWQIAVHDSVFSLCCHSIESHSKKVFAGLANGTLAVLLNVCDAEPCEDPLYIHVGHGPVTSLSIINNQLFCASGSVIHILHADTLDVLDRLMVSSNPFDHILCMAHGLAGLWVAIQGSSVVELWDPKLLTCKLLFDVRENRQVVVKKDDDGRLSTKRVTAILPVDDALWVGTGEGTIYIYDLIHSIPNDGIKVNKYLYGKAPNSSRNRPHRNGEKMTACMRLKQSKLYSSSDTDLRNINPMKQGEVMRDVVSSDGENTYSVKALRVKKTAKKTMPIDERPIVDCGSPRAVHKTLVEQSETQSKKDMELRRKEFRKGGKSGYMRKSRIPKSSSSDKDDSCSSDDNTRSVRNGLNFHENCKNQKNDLRRKLAKKIERDYILLDDSTDSSASIDQIDESCPVVPHEKQNVTENGLPSETNGIDGLPEKETLKSTETENIVSEKVPEVVKKACETDEEISPKSPTKIPRKNTLNNEKDGKVLLSRESLDAMVTLNATLPTIIKLMQEKKALEPVESNVQVETTLLSHRRTLSRTLPKDFQKTPLKDVDELDGKSSSSYEIIDNISLSDRNETLKNSEREGQNRKKKENMCNGNSDSKKPEILEQGVKDGTKMKKEKSGKPSSNQISERILKKQSSVPEWREVHDEKGVQKTSKQRSGKLQVNLRLEAKIKISDQPIRCLHKTKDKEQKTVIISCSGCYGGDESILKWKKLPTEKIWTNEPVYEICPETKQPIFPSYFQKTKQHMSSENLANSPYFSRKGRSYSSPTN